MPLSSGWIAGDHVKACCAFVLLAMMAACRAVGGPAAELGGVHFEALSRGVWMHTSYTELPVWGPYPTNGLIVVDGDESILIDTAWNNAQTETILRWAKSELGKPISRAIFTHAHNDKMGGVAVVNSAGIVSYASSLSNEIAPAKGLTPARRSLELSAVGDSVTLWELEVVYPGGGHTIDNIVLWLPAQEILFGGCLVRPPQSQSLGNTNDAQLNSWDAAVDFLRARYPMAEWVVPSHGRPKGIELLEQTSALVRQHRSK